MDNVEANSLLGCARFFIFRGSLECSVMYARGDELAMGHTKAAK